MSRNISILLINPWIMDFAAYNLWAEPLGLFYVASILKHAGASLGYVNCLASTKRENPAQKSNGCSKYIRTITEKPRALSFVPRNYAVYGIEDDEFVKRVSEAPVPDAVLITSHMTYWYPGVFKVISILKDFYKKKVPIVLGGIYAKLCTVHAKSLSGADYIFTDNNLGKLIPLIERITGKRLSNTTAPGSFERYPLPMHELGIAKRFFAVLTTRGCPYRCSYCASHSLWCGFSRRDPDSVIKEIAQYVDIMKTKNIAFYDDALLVDAENHIIPILKKIRELRLSVKIHLPNGINASLITKRVAEQFRTSGVETLRIGFETANEKLQRMTGAKTTNEDYIQAVHHLRAAGYNRKAIGTYIIAGFPDQRSDDVENSIQFVYEAGAAPYLSYFSPIPETAIWKSAIEATPFPIDREPLFQNNSVYLLGNEEFSPERVQQLRDIALQLRNKS
ncbi:MAG: radical SAM protein [Spirochaetota bacterium]|nr:MAG: radical SAM protein [Spirochaetota bacterium]